MGDVVKVVGASHSAQPQLHVITLLYLNTRSRFSRRSPSPEHRCVVVLLLLLVFTLISTSSLHRCTVTISKVRPNPPKSVTSVLSHAQPFNAIAQPVREVNLRGPRRLPEAGQFGEFTFLGTRSTRSIFVGSAVQR